VKKKFQIICFIAIAWATVFCISSPGSLQAMTDKDPGAFFPIRIVSLGPINTENVYLLGAGDRLVGDTVYCVRPKEAKTKVKVGTVMEASVEKIISLRPDLVLATGLTSADLIKHLRSSGIKVVLFEQPKSFTQSCDQFLDLGGLLGLEKKAQVIIEGVQKTVDNITREVKQYPRQKVFLQVGSQPLHGSVNASFTHDYIELANGKNIIADQSNGRTDYEKVIAANPDVIIIAIMGSESGIAGQEKSKWQKLSVINAVKQNRIHIIDPDIACSPSPASFVEVLRIIAGFIHPEARLEELP
jgi:iron complex transport system substrate-binding protein